MKTYSYTIWPRLVMILLSVFFAGFMVETWTSLSTGDIVLFGLCALASGAMALDTLTFRLTITETGLETVSWLGFAKRSVTWEEMELLREGRGWPKLFDYVVLTEQTSDNPIGVSRWLEDQPEVLEAIVKGARQVKVDDAIRARLRAYKEKQVR